MKFNYFIQMGDECFQPVPVGEPGMFDGMFPKPFGITPPWKGPVKGKYVEARWVNEPAVCSIERANQIWMARSQLPVRRHRLRCWSRQARTCLAKGPPAPFASVLHKRRPLVIREPPTASSLQRQPRFSTANSSSPFEGRLIAAAFVWLNLSRLASLYS